MTLATIPQDIFGTIKPPITSIPNEPLTAAGSLLSAAIQIFIFIAAIALLIYLLWGALDWIISGGDKEKLSKAQQKITNAVVGIIIVIAVLSVFCLVTVEVLHISDSCFTFRIPTISP